MIHSQPLKLSVIIKALNEEQHIEAAIRSALLAIQPFNAEVILADSLSTDRTVEIARQFPVVITQLRNAADRRCGVGPQLGYQVAAGEFIYILDGDMELDPAFLPLALKALENDPKLAGVAGLVEEESDASYQFRGRKRREREREAGEVLWLDMGGLYRAAAITGVGFSVCTKVPTGGNNALFWLSFALAILRWMILPFDTSTLKVPEADPPLPSFAVMVMVQLLFILGATPENTPV